MTDSTTGSYQLYKYDPSFAAALIGASAFGITTLLHIFQLVKNKTWYFIPFVIGGLFEVIGYIGRIISSKQASGEWTLMPYLIQTLFLLLGPSLLSASIYMVLGRMIRVMGAESLSPIRVNWLTKIFVVGDVVSFLMQGSGGGMLAKATTTSATSLGNTIIKLGLLIQIVFFAFFMVVSVIFNIRLQRNPTLVSKSGEVPWTKLLYVLYAASFLILIRCIFRFLEYVQGQNGYLLEHEVYMYIFDAVLMFFAMSLFNICHPSSITNVQTYSPFDEESQSIAMHPPSPSPNPYNGRGSGY
ncbi:hypothetical protein BP5796_05549 [Coleophoma crateriformis]|uniref:RTA1-domain-containing protein n=1 Tax=Coleophoma crateriformis TaxID=565419 RepID=A0A3D8S433_9HELO|nr:hypothetical protein BP5796_05549 [Coleophoma crateriformis]